jgi:hypothetical protein
LTFGEFSFLSSWHILVIPGYIASKHFLPFCAWPFQFREHVFCCGEAF